MSLKTRRNSCSFALLEQVAPCAFPIVGAINGHTSSKNDTNNQETNPYQLGFNRLIQFGDDKRETLTGEAVCVKKLGQILCVLGDAKGFAYLRC